MNEVIINTVSVEWTEDEKFLWNGMRKKLALCFEKGARLGQIYEDFLALKKNISTEAAIFNQEGMLYVVRRPSKDEKVEEPYPNMEHCPGTTHELQDAFPDTVLRIGIREFNKPLLHVVPVFPEAGKFLPEVQDPPRGPYLQCVIVAMAPGDPINKRGRFVPIGQIPWDQMVASHRNVVIPEALRFYPEWRKFVEKGE